MIQNKQLRATGQLLHPVVIIGENKLTASVLKEIDNRLRDHELIKIQSRLQDRKQNSQLFVQVGKLLNATVIQTIGRTALLFRPVAGKTPKFSNIRHINEAHQ